MLDLANCSASHSIAIWKQWVYLVAGAVRILVGDKETIWSLPHHPTWIIPGGSQFGFRLDWMWEMSQPNSCTAHANSYNFLGDCGGKDIKSKNVAIFRNLHIWNVLRVCIWSASQTRQLLGLSSWWNEVCWKPHPSVYLQQGMRPSVIFNTGRRREVRECEASRKLSHLFVICQVEF